MQACIYEAYGAADVVRLAEVATPEVARDDEVLVRVHATSVTTADWRFRAAVFPRGFRLLGRMMVGLFRPRNPILGMDFSGVVQATGPAVSRFRVGDAVFGSTSAMRRGAHAEYVTVRESDAVVRKPRWLAHELAAAIPFGGNSALAFVRDFGQVRAGANVLVIGASGGVGVWAVQLARHFGARVTGVCSTRNVELVRSLGAHRVLDYTAEPFVESGERYDLVLDTVGGTTFGECREVLSERGVYLPIDAGLREIAQAALTRFGSGQRVRWAVSQNTREGLETLLPLIESGAAKPVIDGVHPMSAIAEAHRRVEGRHKRGSVVVTMTPG
ncbi:MAG: NAD(P)-dependent alcohol dehydrogenase [Deltaproteobacteria bacterium]|nr:NAD(P)-dependent alcohol dehydrogenase [Deltaproteobacteria bacterium]